MCVCLFQGEFVACVLALLRQLKDKEYQQLLSRFPTKDELTVKSPLRCLNNGA